jgi:DNA-binding CsgD family transcriptional regulator
VVSLLANGLTTQQIAENLFLSVLTVRTHLRNAKAKLGGLTTYHAVALVVHDAPGVMRGG